jgi:hypothetical protein
MFIYIFSLQVYLGIIARLRVQLNTNLKHVVNLKHLNLTEPSRELGLHCAYNVRLPS